MSKSKSMGIVRQKDTEPELLLRRALWAEGCRYRVHDKRLPGTPDIVFRSARVAVFVHGCFWHNHGCKRSAVKPKANSAFWEDKFRRNEERDARAVAQLVELGWQPVIVWQCEPVDEGVFRIRSILKGPEFAS